MVIQGGINDTDWRLNPDPLTKAFDATIATAKSDYPNARIVVLGPMAPTNAYELAVGQVDQTLSTAAAAVKVPFIDAYQLGWFTMEKRTGKVAVKLVHPNQDGYALIADDFVQYVQAKQ